MKKIILSLIIGMILLISLNLSSALIIDSVLMTPNEIAPGETSSVIIGIENNGEIDLEDVSVSLNLLNAPFAPYDSSTDYNIDEIEEGDEETARFEIIALNDAESGIYKIPVEISYMNNEVPVIKNSLISVTVNSKPVMGVHVENSLFLKGSEKEILVEVTNKGLSDARFLEVAIEDSNQFSVRFKKFLYWRYR
ncbi:hypothetical protein HOD75_04185 [archaeon]|jgi:hypothetical protein|nr:hypothetical protein [archaeon]MBT4242066.1 hypothetical protein [archaeon]MBT4417754.1 hypothetical protein [archaeon]